MMSSSLVPALIKSVTSLRTFWLYLTTIVCGQSERVISVWRIGAEERRSKQSLSRALAPARRHKRVLARLHAPPSLNIHASACRA